MGMVKQTAKLEVPKETKRTLPPIPKVPTADTYIKQIDEHFAEKAGDDKVLNTPKTRDRAIETQALMKSCLESPLVAQLTMGQNQATAMKTFEEVFKEVLALYDRTK